MTNIRRLWLCLLVSLCPLAFFLSIACTSGDDDDSAADDDTDGGDENAFSPCDETVQLLNDLEEVSTLLGISAADLLAATGDGFIVTATYTEDTSILTQSPLGGETELTVTVAYDGGEIREVDSEPVENGAEIAGECLDRLELEVALSFVTADGAFTENWPALLVQSVSANGTGFSDPTLSASFDPSAMTGSFEIVSIAGEPPDSVSGAIQTTMVAPYQGMIVILVEQTSGEGPDSTVSQSQHVALSWDEAL